jgi:hypothetical protein
MPNLAKMKALLEDAKAAYKAQFTGGFYHGSPSPNIKAFDPLKNTDPMKLETPGVTFATRDPDFAESFLPGSERGGYKAGATMYPVSINLGKHWHPNQPESQQVVEDYLKKMYPHEANPQDLVDIKKDMLKAKWEDIENPNFLQHLRDTGHDTFHVMEGGIPNVGVLKPENIRGKFAAFNPEDAASPEIMKAAGGSVEGYAGGGKIGALTELMQLIKQQGGTNAAKRLERAADLVPNLENKFQPQALKSTFAGDNASAVMVMKPGDFQKYATPLPEGHKTWDQFKIEDQDRRGNYQDYLDYLGRVSNESGFSSVPYLQLDRKAGSFFPEITGHEGRNRSEALDKLGDQSSLVQMIPRAGLRESFPRRSNEEYLNMLHSEIGSKPMVTVQPDWDPDSEKWIRRGLRDLPEMFAGGGKIEALKQLAHAVTVPFTHFSPKADLTTLDPRKYGTGMKGAEAARLSTATDIAPRSYFYHGENIVPESGVGGNKYTGVSQNSYPWSKDPANFYEQARTNDPYLMQMGIRQHSPEHTINNMERLIKEAGYDSYHTDTGTGVLFNDTPVIKAQ